MQIRHCPFVLAAALLCGGGTARAARAVHDTGWEPPENAGAVSGHGAGLKALIDPRTGELTDTPATLDQALFLREALPRRDYSKMQLEHRPDGSIVLHTNGQWRMSTIVQQQADGSIREVCLPSAQQEPRP